MARFIVDANVLMNAALINDSLSRRLVEVISAEEEHQLYIDETTWHAIEGVFDRKVRQFRLRIRPMEILQAFVAGGGFLFVPGAVGGEALRPVNEPDRSLAAAALANDCVLLSDDHELIAEARRCGIDARTVLQAGVPLGEGRGPGRVYRGRRPLVGQRRTKLSGHLLFRGRIGTGTRNSRNILTAFDAVGRVRIYYDCEHSRWVADFDGLPRNLRVSFDQSENQETLVALSYRIDSQPGAIDRFKLAVGESLQRQNQNPLRVRAINWLQLPRGQIHIGSSRNNSDHLNGHVAQVAYGPGQIGQGTWRAMLQDRTIMPSMYDADVLDAALLMLDHTANAQRLVLPSEADLF